MAITADEAKEQFRRKLKDLVWSFRERYSGFASVIDRWFFFLARTNVDFTIDQLNEKLIAFRKLLPRHTDSVLLDYIQTTVRIYWSFCNSPNEKTAAVLNRRLTMMERVLRQGAILVPNNVRGWQLEAKK